MGEEDKKERSVKRISEKERYKYVGFEVAPGRIKNIFKSDAEKAKLVEEHRQKREHRSGLGALRDECTLLEDRVTMRDRIFLTLACVVMVGALFLPWYSAYNEIVEESSVKPAVVGIADSTAVNDSMPADSAAAAATQAASDQYSESEAPKEEVIHGYVARKKIHKEYTRLSGIGSLADIGSVGSRVFSSGIVLIITGVLFLVMTVLSLALPAYTLFGIFGLKGNPDQRALKLKAILKLNWLPLVLFAFCLVISFVGAGYGAGTANLYTSLGSSYSVAAFFSNLSWGVFVMLAASIMLAAKGIEI